MILRKNRVYTFVIRSMAVFFVFFLVLFFKLHDETVTVFKLPLNIILLASN